MSCGPGLLKLLIYQLASLALAQFAAEIAEGVLLVRAESGHDFGNPPRMVGKDASNHLGTRRSDGSQNEALVLALLFALHQATLLQVVDHERKIAAAGQDAAREVSQALWANVEECLQHGKLAQSEPLFFEANAGVRKSRARGALKLHVGAQSTLLHWCTFELVGHDVETVSGSGDRRIYRKHAG